MYPSRLGYAAPKTVEEAIALLHAGNGEAKVLAGGQSLVPMLKLRFAISSVKKRNRVFHGLGCFVSKS
jgi:CO/xanthine dehydrogenase FAD-binding subunit